MWSIGVLILCMGLPAPDKGNCQAFEDVRGPYETKVECEARLEEILGKLPKMWAEANRYSGTVTAKVPECEKPGIDI